MTQMAYAVFNCKSGFTLNMKHKIIKSHWVEYWETDTNKKLHLFVYMG